MNHKKLAGWTGKNVLRCANAAAAMGTRAPLGSPRGPNQRWSLDFVSDSLIDGRRFRILCVIDAFSRECLATVVTTRPRAPVLHGSSTASTGI